MTFLSATILLFLVFDPIGNIPFFLVTLKDLDSKRRKFVLVRELCIALGVLILFLFSGQYVLSFLQVSQSSLGIAGGIILFLIAIKMIFSGSEEMFNSGDIKGEPLIVPLAIPFIAGPSAMATVILIMAKDPSRWMVWLGALICAWFITGIILLSSNVLSRLIGKRGLTALERLMGMILTTVAVEMLISGIKSSFF